MNSFQQNVIKHKVGLLNLAAELGNVSRACKVMGFSRDTFYRYQSAMEVGGVDALINANRRKPNHKNRARRLCFPFRRSVRLVAAGSRIVQEALNCFGAACRRNRRGADRSASVRPGS